MSVSLNLIHGQIGVSLTGLVGPCTSSTPPRPRRAWSRTGPSWTTSPSPSSSYSLLEVSLPQWIVCHQKFVFQRFFCRNFHVLDSVELVLGRLTHLDKLPVSQVDSVGEDVSDVVWLTVFPYLDDLAWVVNQSFSFPLKQDPVTEITQWEWGRRLWCLFLVLDDEICFLSCCFCCCNVDLVIQSWKEWSDPPSMHDLARTITILSWAHVKVT